MNTVVDSSLWVDFFRASPPVVKAQIQPILTDPATAICEPIRFELLRAVPKRDRPRVDGLLATVPVLSTPPGLWADALRLGQRCTDAGFQPPSIDLLIAQVCLHHQASLVACDQHFQSIAKVSALRVTLLKRVGP